jgi:hypothetical protein
LISFQQRFGGGLFGKVQGSKLQTGQVTAEGAWSSSGRGLRSSQSLGLARGQPSRGSRDQSGRSRDSLTAVDQFEKFDRTKRRTRPGVLVRRATNEPGSMSGGFELVCYHISILQSSMRCPVAFLALVQMKHVDDPLRIPPMWSGEKLCE